MAPEVLDNITTPPMIVDMDHETSWSSSCKRFELKMKHVLLIAILSTFYACSSDANNNTNPSSDGGNTGEIDAAQDSTSNVDTGASDDASVDPGVDVRADVGIDVTNDSAGDTTPAIAYGFFAQGDLGRTTYSCDGDTWSSDRSYDEAQRCYDQNGDDYDCNHGPGAARGLAVLGDSILATFGWGAGGGIFRTTDGVTLEPLIEDTTFANIAVGQGAIMAGSNPPTISTDNGATWNDVSGDPGFTQFNIRTTAFADVDGGRFIFVANSAGPVEVRVTADAGATWMSPNTNGACGANVQFRDAIASAGSMILIVGGDGVVCSSTDGGASWTPQTVTDGATSDIVHDGDAFMFWNRSTRWRSVDGTTWEQTEISPNNLRIGSVAFGDGTYVAVNSGFRQWYEQQTFWRSTDGINWTEAAAYSKSHPIQHMIYAPLPVCD